MSGRDPVMDIARVGCLVCVVLGHLLLLGASVTARHDLVLVRPLELQAWFTPVTWVTQIMPLFFAIGGFVGAQAWRRIDARGGTAAEFIRGRVLRLARPAVPFFAFLAIAILAMLLSGLDSDTVGRITSGVASPLWFLAAYTFSQAFVPGMVALHERAPVRTLVGLAVAAIALDVTRWASGISELGLFNMIFVWLFIQQLGVWAADGWFAARSRWSLSLLVVASFATLALLTELGAYPANMLDNLNPPTVALCLQGIAQLSLLMLLHPLLDRMMHVTAIRRIVAAVGSRLMTIYLWHLPVIALIVGLLLLSPVPSPEPGTVGWWLTRPVILLIAILLLTGITIALRRFEQPIIPRSNDKRVHDWSVSVSASLVILPPFTVVVFGLNFAIAVVGTVLLALAVLLQLPPRWSRRSRRSAQTVHSRDFDRLNRR
ncbi:acyltransferase [Leifsonia kafniensis]|uniref:acyltransferase family protein n=1 Tax=Leifsonia kafniensis TaxID=475957 RepID=UPI0031EFC596